MLAEPQPTPFDLRFRLFGTHVSVHPFFWVMALVFGWQLTTVSLVGDNGMVALGIWMVCVFVSILLHEFGHIWVGRYFGSEGYIVLHGFGGLAVGSNALYSPWKRITVSAAGPAIQLVLFGLLWGALRLFEPSPLSVHPVVGFFLLQMMFINLYWPLLNLLPIWPLDGGMITRELCTMGSPSRGLEGSLWVSLLCAAALAVNGLMATEGARQQGVRPFIPYAPTGTFSIIFFALLAVGSWQALQAARSRKSWSDDHREW